MSSGFYQLIPRQINMAQCDGRCSALKIVLFQQWDPELARVAQKWADQCAQVDYKGDVTRKDPILVHDKHADRKIGSIFLSVFQSGSYSSEKNIL